MGERRWSLPFRPTIIVGDHHNHRHNWADLPDEADPTLARLGLPSCFDTTSERDYYKSLTSCSAHRRVVSHRSSCHLRASKLPPHQSHWQALPPHCGFESPHLQLELRACVPAYVCVSIPNATSDWFLGLGNPFRMISWVGCKARVEEGSGRGRYSGLQTSWVLKGRHWRWKRCFLFTILGAKVAQKLYIPDVEWEAALLWDYLQVCGRIAAPCGNVQVCLCNVCIWSTWAPSLKMGIHLECVDLWRVGFGRVWAMAGYLVQWSLLKLCWFPVFLFFMRSTFGELGLLGIRRCVSGAIWSVDVTSLLVRRTHNHSFAVGKYLWRWRLIHGSLQSENSGAMCTCNEPIYFLNFLSLFIFISTFLGPKTLQFPLLSALCPYNVWYVRFLYGT